MSLWISLVTCVRTSLDSSGTPKWLLLTVHTYRFDSFYLSSHIDLTYHGSLQQLGNAVRSHWTMTSDSGLKINQKNPVRRLVGLAMCSQGRTDLRQLLSVDMSVPLVRIRHRKWGYCSVSNCSKGGRESGYVAVKSTELTDPFRFRATRPCVCNNVMACGNMCRYKITTQLERNDEQCAPARAHFKSYRFLLSWFSSHINVAYLDSPTTLMWLILTLQPHKFDYFDSPAT